MRNRQSKIRNKEPVDFIDGFFLHHPTQMQGESDSVCLLGLKSRRFVDFELLEMPLFTTQTKPKRNKKADEHNTRQP